MDYTLDLFTTTKEASSYTRYRYILKGAFYDVFTDGNGDYHMAKEVEASLRERVWFYQNRIAHHPYPVLDKTRGLVMDNRLNSYAVMLQVLGLPEELLSVQEKGMARILTAEEVLSRIHFEEDLFFGYGAEKNITSDIVSTDDYCVIGLINYWIENGFYFPNPERLYQMDGTEFSYPVYLDVRKIPKLLTDIPMSIERLFIDFVQEPLDVDRRRYEKEFLPLEKMSMEEKFQHAFNSDQFNLQSVIALQNYFSALLKILGNQFFAKEFQTEKVFSQTCLEEDLGFHHQSESFMAVGSRIVMPKYDYRQFFKDEEGQVHVKIADGEFKLFADDAYILEDTYEYIQKFFSRHPQYCAMPFLAIRLLGLPYRAFPQAKHFDFQKGTFSQFLSLYSVVAGSNEKTYRIYWMRDADGTLLSLNPEDEQSALPIYLLEQQKRGFYLGDFDQLSSFSDYDNLLKVRSNNKKIMRFVQGESKICFEIIDAIQKETYDTHPKGTVIPSYRAYFLEEEKDGMIPCIKEFFDCCSQGMTTRESMMRCFSKDSSVSSFEIGLFLIYMLRHLVEKQAKEFIKRIKKNLRPDRYAFGLQGEIFTDPYLPYPQVYKGRYFLFYTDGKRVICDVKQKEAIQNAALMFRKLFLRDRIFPYIEEVDDASMSFFMFDKPTDYIMEEIFLGIPSALMNRLDENIDPVSQIVFEKDVDILSREDHQNIKFEDPTLHDYPIIQKAFEKGILIYGKKNNGRMAYPLREKLDDSLRYVLSPDYIKIFALNFYFNQQKKEEKFKDYFLKMSDDEFRNSALKYAEGKIPDYLTPLRNELLQYMVFYSSTLTASLYHSLEDQIYSTKSSCYILGTNIENQTVSFGDTFLAYKDGNGYFLPETDKELINKAIVAVESIYKNEKNVRRKALQMTALLGLPSALKVQAYRLLLSEERTDKDLTSVFGFRPQEETLFHQYTSGDSDFVYQKAVYGGRSENIWVRREALRQGYFLGSNQIVHEVFNQVLKTFPVVEKNYDEIKSNKVYLLDELTLDAKAVFLPCETVFSGEVKSYFRIWEDGQRDLSYLLYLKESLYHLYYENPRFIPEAINHFYTEKKAVFIKEMKSKINRLKLKEISETFSPESIVYGIVFFLLFLEKTAIEKISMRLLLKE